MNNMFIMECVLLKVHGYLGMVTVGNAQELLRALCSTSISSSPWGYPSGSLKVVNSFCLDRRNILSGNELDKINKYHSE